jgi:hypothetical protein
MITAAVVSRARKRDSIRAARTLNRHVERVFNSNRKDTHWGKRKLKRDE